MSKPKDVESEQVVVWLRKDLTESINAFRLKMSNPAKIISRKEAIERLLEHAIKHPPQE